MRGQFKICSGVESRPSRYDPVLPSGGTVMTIEAMPTTLRVDIWSDVVCPWCAIGKANLDAALTEFAHADSVEIMWHSYELDPNAPAARAGNYAEMIARKYSMSTDQAQSSIDQMTARAEDVGLDFRFDLVQPGNTFDAHRMVHLGAVRGIQTRVKERFLRGYLSEGEAIGLPEVVERLAIDAGLDAEEVAVVLAGSTFADDVRADEALAHELGVTGVPFFVIDRRYAVAGAQPADVLLDVLDRAWSEREPALDVVVEGEVCGPEGCD
jgi:predicted DsbA family dithiol-disulfide isomerase